MAYLYCRTQIRILTQIRIPNQMATLYYAEHFTLHGLGLRSLLSICVGVESESESVPESVSGHVNEPTRSRRFHRIHRFIYFFCNCTHWTPCSPPRDREIVRLREPDLGPAGHASGGAAAQGARLSPQLQTGRARKHDRTRYTIESCISLVQKTDNKPMYHIETPVYSLAPPPPLLYMGMHPVNFP